MSISVNWTNPYTEQRGSWYVGNLHSHTTVASACSILPLERMLDLYVEGGYDFLAVSDHMALTTANDRRLTFLPGLEWNAPDGNQHAGYYALDPALVAPQAEETSLETLLEAAQAPASLAVLNHPNWQLTPHYRREELLRLHGYDGIEIFNGVIKRLQGCETATDKWDYLLMNGRRVLGFASDDSHAEEDIHSGWIVVRAPGNSPTELMTAIKSGNFYCSSGTEILSISRDDGTIELETRDGQEIQVIGNGGQIMRTYRDRGATIRISGFSSPYLRFTIYGQGSEMAWTQPFFIEG